jgi:putative ABC transport system substrate-binding protein
MLPTRQIHWTAEIVRQQPDLILAAASAPALALTRATSTIPIVVNSLGDPLSLVASIEHPGGNLTGSLQTPPGFNQTKLNLVHEALPGVTRLAILRSTTNPFPAIFDEMKAAAERNGMVVQSISVRNFPDDVPAAIDEAVAGTAGAILQVPDGTFSAADTQRIAERAMQNRIPYIAAARAGVVSAGLMSFEPGTLPNAPIRVAAEYVDKILKGAKPGDLAMRGPSGTLITLNEKTARAIGVTLPASVLAKASENLR